MREYGRIHCAFWTSIDIQSMSEDGRWLAMYLLSSPHTTIIGAFRLPDGYICEDMKWTSERVSKGFDELFAKGFANRCGTTKWVWIRKFLQWNAPENPNQWKAAKKVAAQIPDGCSWKADFDVYFLSLPASGEEPFDNGSKRVSKSGSGSGSGSGSTTAAKPPRAKSSQDPEPDWLADFRREYPDRLGGQEWRKAVRAGNARIAEGHTAAEFIAGAQRYHAHCKSLDKIGTQFVKQAASFLGRDKHFLESWPVQPARVTKPSSPPAFPTPPRFPS